MGTSKKQNKNCSSLFIQIQHRLLFSNTLEAASQFYHQGVPSSIWISPSKASQQRCHHRAGHVSLFCFGFFFFFGSFCFCVLGMNSWITRSWMCVGAADANLTIGVSNVGYCLCLRFAGSLFSGIPLAGRASATTREQHMIRICIVTRISHMKQSSYGGYARSWREAARQPRGHVCKK